MKLAMRIRRVTVRAALALRALARIKRDLDRRTLRDGKPDKPRERKP